MISKPTFLVAYRSKGFMVVDSFNHPTLAAARKRLLYAVDQGTLPLREIEIYQSVERVEVKAKVTFQSEVEDGPNT